MVRPDSPGMAVASMKSTSPPAPVTARPVATPGTEVRSAASAKNRGRPSQVAHVASVHGDRCLSRRPIGRRLAQQLAQLPLERTHAGLTGVVGHDRPEGIVGDVHLAWVQAIGLDLTGRADDPVRWRPSPLRCSRRGGRPPSCRAAVRGSGRPCWRSPGTGRWTGPGRHRGSGRGTCGSGPGPAPRAGRGRIAPPVAAELVDLVQQDHRIHGAGLLDGPDDAAGQGADIGPPVSSDLGLVPDAAKGDPDELAAHGAGNGLTEAGLAHTWGTDQRKDHAAGAPTG